jgi:hypothetical protein
MSTDGLNLYLHEALVKQLGMQDTTHPNDEYYLGKFIFGSKNGGEYSIHTRLEPNRLHNQRYYKVFLKEAQFRQENPGKTQNPLYARFTTEGIISIKDSYRRNRDLSVLGGLGFYAINIIDAYVDAKFFRFDISDDLSVKVSPSLNQGPIHASGVSPVLGVKLKITL